MEALLGVVIGGILAWVAQWDASRRTRDGQRKVAIMQIAHQTHLWLTETTHNIAEHEVWEGGNPSEDPNDVSSPSIPDFPFEKSLDVISLLPSKHAEKVFGLMESKLSAGKEASFISAVQDNEDAAETYAARLAAIIVGCAGLYSELAKEVGWTGTALSEEEIGRWRKSAAKLDEIRNRPSGIDIGDLPSAA